MRLIRSLNCLTPEFKNELLRPYIVGVTVGNFDGMHLGHQSLFRALDQELAACAKNEAKKALKVLVTFHPHPRQVLTRVIESAAGKTNPADARFNYLTSTREKIELARKFGFDLFFLVRFSREFSELSPEMFVKEYLVSGLGAKVVVVGYDWAFGKGRAGSPESLRQFGRQFGFSTQVVEPVEIDGVRVSSSTVKNALSRSDLSTVERLLGRPFAVSGHVGHGDKRGRTLGFPTANLYLPKQILPPDGVYATRAEGNGKLYFSATNVGTRPTFAGKTRLVEVHIIEKKIDLYKHRVRVQFIKRIRDEEKFQSVDALKDAIAKDVRTAESVLGKIK